MRDDQIMDGGHLSDAAPERISIMGWATIAILLLMTIMSYMDRTLIALMVDPIKKDLGITDVQFSLLQGFAFALLYAGASLPMGWLSDRYSRHWVIYAGMTAWSVATALCGTAANFIQLFLARVGVGLGEATLTPSSYAMITDIFPARRVGLAIGLLAAGTSIGGGLAFVIGGLTVHWAETANILGFTSWHLVFLIIGLPGVLVAPLIFIIPRTRHRGTRTVDAGELRDPSYLKWLKANGAYLSLLFGGITFNAITAIGLSAWVPAYLSRHFGLDPKSVGGTLGLVTAVSGAAGYIFGGWIVDRLNSSKNFRDAHYRYFLFSAVGTGVAGMIGFTITQSVPVLMAMLAVIYILVPVSGPAVALLQQTTPSHFRARTIALMTLTFTSIGMTVGPTSVAFFAEHIFGGPQYVGQGIALMIGIFEPLAVLCFLLGIGPARRAMARAAIGRPIAGPIG